MKTGLYEIVNTTNGNRYVGSATDINQRWSVHRGLLRRGKHHSRHMQHSWLKHGESAFNFRMLLICSKENLIMYEQRAIDALKPAFNVLPFAHNSLGFRHSQETRAKMSAACVGKPATTKGFKHTPESCAKMGVASRGRIRTAEIRANMSAAQRGKKYAPGRKTMKGFKHSAETRAKVSAGLTGRKVSAETRAKMSSSIRLALAKLKQEKNHGPIVS